MILILEGNEAMGKTTLANLIAEQTKMPIIHRSYKTDDMPTLELIEDYKKLIRGHKNIILDRAWPSTWVYQQVLTNRPDEMSLSACYMLEKVVAKTGGMYIWATDNIAKSVARATRRGEDYVNVDQMVEIEKYYKEFFGMPHLIPVVRYTIND